MRIPRSKILPLPDALVVDANALISAAPGGRAADALILALDSGIEVCGAPEVADEVREWLPSLARKHGLDEGLLLATFAMLPVDWKEASLIKTYERQARDTIGDRDPEDWPTVALALAMSGRFAFEGRSARSLGNRIRFALVAPMWFIHTWSERLQSPMGELGKPLHRNPKTVLGSVLHKVWLAAFPRMIRYQTVAIWTNDRDFADVGIATVTTAELLRMFGR